MNGVKSSLWYKRQPSRKIFPLEQKAMYPFNPPLCAVPHAGAPQPQRDQLLEAHKDA